MIRTTLAVAPLLLMTAPWLLMACSPPQPVLAPGDRAPAFRLTGSDGKVHDSTAYRGKYLVLAWFPKAFTGG
jgi:hypothetical protein